MTTHPSVLAWRVHGQRPWWAIVYGVSKNQTGLSTHMASIMLYYFLSSLEDTHMHVIIKIVQSAVE